MIKIRTSNYQYPVNAEQKSYGVGEGVFVRFIPGGATPPVITNGILLEGSSSDFLMLEDTTSYLLQE